MDLDLGSPRAGLDTGSETETWHPGDQPGVCVWCGVASNSGFTGLGLQVRCVGAAWRPGQQGLVWVLWLQVTAWNWVQRGGPWSMNPGLQAQQPLSLGANLVFRAEMLKWQWNGPEDWICVEILALGWCGTWSGPGTELAC